MLLLRRLCWLSSLLVAVVCTVLLLNVTAPNPTGRRYSSDMPLTTGQGSAGEIGLDGERVLAADLGGVPRNDSPDQRQCFCNETRRTTPPPADCRACYVYAQLLSDYRRPDFVTDTYIAESKNTRNLFYENRDFDQVGDYVIAARALGRPLWLFTRVDTRVDAEFYRMVRSTGGDVVPYFTVPGYVDPVDRAALAGLGASLTLFALLGLLEMLYYNRRPLRPRSAPPAPEPARAPARPAAPATPPIVPDDPKTQVAERRQRLSRRQSAVPAPEDTPLRRAQRSTRTAREFEAKIEDQAWLDIDTGDAWQDQNHDQDRPQKS